MGALGLTLRAGLRLRWRALLGLALLLGLIGGITLTAAAGARRTETAYPRFRGRLAALSLAQVAAVTGAGWATASRSPSPSPCPR